MTRWINRGRPADSPPPARGPFLRRLRTLLEGTAHEQLKRHLLEHAKSLPPDERIDFLEMLGPGESPLETPSGLVADIATFIAALRRDEYADDAWSGDAAWVDHFEALMSRTTKAFIAGERAVVAEALGLLLRVFDLNGEVAAFCGEEPAEFQVRSDLAEVLAIHLRAIYETTPPNQRAARLLEEINALRSIGCWRVGLQAIMDADAEPLADLDRFLPVWIEAVSQLVPQRDNRPFDVRGFLLREATLLVAGADGLGNLARLEGREEPQTYHEWLDALLRANRRDDALAAAHDAVAAVEAPWERARLADRLATLAVEGGDEALALEASRTAWRSHPSLRRLRRLCGVGTPDSGTLRSRLVAESEAAERGEINPCQRLEAVIDLMLGDVVSAMDRLVQAPALGWSRGDHPGPTVFPCALLAAAGLATPPKGSALSGLWEKLDDDVDLAADCTGFEGLSKTTPDSAEPPALCDLLSTSLGRLDLAPEIRRRLVELLRRVVEKRVEAVVSGKHRGAYARIALLAAAWADGAALAGSPDDGTAFLDSLRARYPRHSAFKGEIDSAARHRASAR